ncbi:GNAT family N-acetyltransferase [Brevibacillus humidisoli]|uniref:GNAT family N-acetyltransferase n=1 Tax=Brevibacillus humidisoli TaxID=2895522 RepID=UPI001E3310F1|nr:GNAT family N-acetyltransferase [Brevibacillus humidisoli]UFJ40810.1 GNAT family N-acetyltransferase [Brevibacillus humidisoli]
MKTIALQRLDETAASDLVALSSSLGWDYSSEDVRTILACGIVYGHWSAEDGVVSSAAIFPYGDRLASIGMVMVREPYRGQGLGKAVTQKCIDALPSGVPIMLIATPEGIPLYERLGFQTVETIEKLLCDRYQQPAGGVTPAGVKSNEGNPAADRSARLHNGYHLCEMTADDVEAVMDLDEAAVGGRRCSFLQARMMQSARQAVIKRPDGTIAGFGLAVQGPELLLLGPIVAPDCELALALIDHLASRHEGNLRIDIPAKQQALRSGLLKRGFCKATQPPVMLKGADQLPSRNDTLFAIAAQAFG